jgi:ABC-type lipoprotein release transport system permease subunit
MKLSFFSLLKIILEGKSSTRFLIGVIASFSFSIAVILCTIGLMDGFESTLVKSLQRASGDLIIKGRSGFFHFDKSLENLNKLKLVKSITPIVQIEAFLISDNISRGVLVKGIDEESFKQVTSLEIELKTGEIVLGSEIAKKLNIKKGQEIVLTFASNSKRNQGSPILKSYKVSGIVEHGVYEKDLRFVYLDRRKLIDLFNYTTDSANMALLKLSDYNSLDELKTFQHTIAGKISKDLKVETFWNEFRTLLEAVEIEKLSISMVLQLIVVVAIFNIVAFIIFISERKSQEFYLLRVLGLTVKSVINFWFAMLFAVWSVSCFVSIGLTSIFNFLLMKLSIFQLPGDIYVLSRLTIDLTLNDYLIVFGAALAWILLIGCLSILRMRKRTLLQGIRQEFS